MLHTQHYFATEFVAVCVKQATASNLVIGVLLAPPAGTEVFNGDAEVSCGEVKQHLFGFVEQVSSETSLDLHHALCIHGQTMQPAHNVSEMS